MTSSITATPSALSAAPSAECHESCQASASANVRCSIGGTHVEQLGNARDLPGPKATLFFAPAQIKKRQGDWGPAELGAKLVRAWSAFRARVTDPAQPWLAVEHHRGTEEVQRAYATVLAGRGDPRVGHMLSLA